MDIVYAFFVFHYFTANVQTDFKYRISKIVMSLFIKTHKSRFVPAPALCLSFTKNYFFVNLSVSNGIIL
jgi:hypothetical protein